MTPSEIIQALIGIIVLLMGGWMGLMQMRLSKLEGKMGAVERVEALLQQHTEREEQQTWPRFDRAAELMTQGLNEVKVAVVRLHERFDHVEGMARHAQDHIEKHDAEADTWKHRIVRLESDVDKLKNGKNHA